ncbi:hypothetical protein [Shimia ponticola]|uniref:hypothetical protein n=1 Tax=Shimia ponticola TaxID=2582893 RepID=UPI0011BD5142|nr:hypothetical protein [Shimia ponticola]
MEKDDDKRKGSGFSDVQASYLYTDKTRPIASGGTIPPGVDDDDDPFAELVGSGGSEAAFTAEDARSRSGNYVIPFGLPGSGKTTLLASLFKYIDESPNLQNEIIIPERRKVPNYAGQAMLNQWQKVFNSGRFLGATPVGADAIRELTYEVVPLKGQKTKLNFSVVEVSGEDLVRVVAREGSNPRLPDALEALFKNSRVRPTIILVVHPNKLENDLLFHNLFTWLNRNVKDRIKTFSLAVVIANPSLALHRLHQRRTDTVGLDVLTGGLTKIYLQEFAPKTFAIYNSWRKEKRAITPLHVGDIRAFEEGEKTVERIVRFDKRNSSQIFSWIYRQFTGKRLGPGTLARIFRQMNS